MKVPIVSVADYGAAQTAAGLIARGVNPLPLVPNSKRPAIDWKHLQENPLGQCSPDEVAAFVESWWVESHHGVGAVTGSASRVVVIDVDDAAAQELVVTTSPLPRTVSVRTRSGTHYWFTHPGGIRRNRTHIGDVGLDARANGGYVVCPPSVHPSGSPYTWIVSPWDMWPPAPIPGELDGLIWPPHDERIEAFASQRSHSGAYALAALESETEGVRSAPEGTRNHTLFHAAFTLSRLVISGLLGAEDVAERLAAAAMEAGLPQLEIQRTIASAYKARRSP